MAGKFIELKEAAAQLGISPDKLQEMREAGEIHGYKDGASWKFKPSEIERIAKERGSSGGEEAADQSESLSLSDDGFADLLNLDDGGASDNELDNSSVLIGGESGEQEQDSSSTVIGKEQQKDEAAEAAAPAGESSAGASEDSSGSGESSQGNEDDYELKLADSKDDSDDLAAGDDLDFESDAVMALDDDVDLELAVDSDDEESVEPDSGSSEGELAVESSGSGSGSDEESKAASGPTLEESAEEGLELPEDEDEELPSVEEKSQEASGEQEMGGVQQDEEFLLSPSDSVLGDESSDSGSQVIALEDSSAFESDADLEGGEADEPMLVEEEGEAEGLGDELEPIDDTAAQPESAYPAGAEAVEAEYNVWNIVALLLVLLLLSTAGMLMTDVVRNMWSWHGDVAASSAVADSIVEWFGMK